MVDFKTISKHDDSINELLPLSNEELIRLNEIGAEIQERMTKMFLDISKNINDMLEEDLRKNATPPIKGELTKGKIKWRGLNLIKINLFDHSETWVEQRGVIITRKIRYNYYI